MVIEMSTSIIENINNEMHVLFKTLAKLVDEKIY